MSEGRVTAFQRLGVAATALTLGLVALGGAVRATGSGLACPDWPFCYGKVLPGTADIPPETGYALWNVWLEHSHRTVASVVGLLVLALAVWALARYRRRPLVLWPSLGALVLVTVQAGLGALVVLQRLRAELVTAHLGLGMLVVACLVTVTVAASEPAALARRAAAAHRADSTPASASTGRRAATAHRADSTPAGASAARRAGGRDRRLARAATAVAALAFVQILVGGHVTGIGAGLAYTDFPLTGGAVVPAVASEQEAFHVAHRLLAYALAAATVYLCARAVRYRREAVADGVWSSDRRWLVTLPVWAASLVVVQIGLGVLNLVTGTAPAVVAAHLAVASLIWTVLVVLVALAYRRVPPRAASGPPPREDPSPRQEALT